LLYRTPKHFKHSKSKFFFCDKSCLAIWKNKNLIIGEKHVSWKHGEYAYRNIMKRSEVALQCKYCGMKDFRVLLVHHIDGNRKKQCIEKSNVAMP
jgi:hypothetical protein